MKINPIPFEITNGMINAVQLEVLNKLNHLAPPGPETPIQKTWNTRSRKPGTPIQKTWNTDPEKPGTPDPENLEHQIQKSLEHQIQKSLEHRSRKAWNTKPEKPGTPIQKSLEHRIQRNLKRITEDRAENACGTIYGSTL